MQIQDTHVQLALQLDSEPVTHSLIDSEFDAEFADQLAQKESYNKHLYRPNTYLHKWWARRCGTTFRALLKHLVLDKSKQDFYTPGGLEGQIILDPMCGGGTTLHEGIRLGANVIGADIDPIPILQARATLSEVPLSQLESEFERFFQTVRSAIADSYQTPCPHCSSVGEQRFVLHGARQSCGCHEAVFVDSYILRHNSDGTNVRICPETYDIWNGDTIVSRSCLQEKPQLLEKGSGDCSCGEKYSDDWAIPYYQRFMPIAIVGECAQHGLFFAAPQNEDLAILDEANQRRHLMGFDQADFAIETGPKSRDLIRRGIENYLDLFSSRQLHYLRAAIDALKDVDESVRLKLALLVSTSTEFNSMLCGYKGSAKNRPGAIRHTFAHHAYSFPYTALENNPVHASKSSGTLTNLYFSRLVRGQKWAKSPDERVVRQGKVSKTIISGEVDAGQEYTRYSDLQHGSHRFMLLHGSSTHLNLPDDSVDHIVTDPPYFDSVQYGDLAAYFHVWLRQMAASEVNWDYLLRDAAVDQQANGDGQYERVLADIFHE